MSLDGGGIRGILPLTIMAELEDTYLGGAPFADCFDLVAGTSTGGIIALGFGSGLTARQLLKIYMERGGGVFPDHGRLTKRVLGITQLVMNRCNTAKLYDLIDGVVGDRQLWESHVRLCIPAAETRHFEPFIFKTPHHPDYKLDWSKPMAHIAKTTSAAPGHFRPVPREDGYEFVDGGIWANNPTMVAVADALACFDIRREQIKVLSLGCVKDSFEMGPWRRRLGGLFFWRKVMFEAMHIQSQNVIGQARLIVGGDRVLRIDGEPIKPKIDLTDWARCRAVLPALGQQIVAQTGELIAAHFLSSTATHLVPFYRPPAAPQS